ncbi:MAG: PAS domain-containing protein [Proteobacteria bacterium]|nr:MAG: PAS domain-containing protein [Pseudomonadota bacterium]
MSSSTDDQDRLDAEELRRAGLLDTPPEEVFDRFTGLAKKILGVQVALITLLDENRQFFKSQTGLPEPIATRRETPLSYSFCKHVVATEKPLIIADARESTLMADNPAIEAMGVVAYAGIPLVAYQGQTIGALCAIDSVPRDWTEHEIDILTDLAQAVMREMDLRIIARDRQFDAGHVESILESIADAFYHLDENWRFTYINNQATQLLQRSKEELLGRGVWEEYPSAKGSIFEIEFLRAKQSGEPVSFEGLHSTLNIWLGVHVYPNDGGLAVYLQDITVRKHNEERLRLLESVVVHANDTVIITEARPIDEPGPRILYVNEAFTQMTGYSAEEAVGRSPRFLQGRETEREPLDRLREGLANYHPITVEIQNYRKDKTLFWVEMSIVPVADENGEHSHLISIQRDITQRRLTQQILQDAKNEAERANLAKSEFLSRMSHELRTPLNAILGFGQLLDMAGLQGNDKESVDQIMGGGRHLLNLINEVLDIARIESGQLSMSLEPVLVWDVCGECLALVRALASQHGITLDVQEACNPWLVMADKQRLKQILLNLLSNAIKYNRAQGTVTLECRIGVGNRLRLSVRDEGSGISLEMQHRLFVPFDRLDIEQKTVDGKSIEGTGIGLALSRRLAEAMGGTLNFVSEEGQGSTFWVELPVTETAEDAGDLAEGEDGAFEAPMPERSSRDRVLYIEDNLSNLKLIERLLERRHVELLCAQQGQLGLDMARETRPALILLDLNLPDLDGQEVLRQLRQDPSTRDIPLVMLSADATPGQVQRLLDAGAQAYLTKPIDVREFYRTVDRLLDSD